ncbi:hypothetical protein HMPREF0290_2697 [Corynebacterium efficiens YS-314]|uniref:Uncharacterized protein n=1 Tax=Corynebacterium efficiens (strain DSM 44549 / YS-314 / AJ 12310 / JCM 11189 / NBRC 100395) TaxID=196164 RepID=Q8FUI6_COREF|nr:hypothetical protein HMPREF0290_2697 [Corynebacterium efficiens YS-314]BAC16842.1 hypothetical protein [Corynebacterium efficiens YS-314]
MGVPVELIFTGVRLALGLLETGAIEFLVTFALGTCLHLHLQRRLWGSNNRYVRPTSLTYQWGSR